MGKAMITSTKIDMNNNIGIVYCMLDFMMNLKDLQQDIKIGINIYPLRVDYSLYLQFSIAFKHIGVLCSSSPNSHVIRSSRFLAGFCGRARM